ncbi:MAG: enoyl-CoA hydratase/isomerase family protein, partial [Planctomycetota bacterium]
MASVDVRVHDATATVVINHPGRGNAITWAMVQDLRQALGDAQQEKRVRAVVLTGAGGTFCAGLDVRELRPAATLDPVDAQLQWGERARGFGELLIAMLELPKPIIASVNGPALVKFWGESS